MSNRGLFVAGSSGVVVGTGLNLPQPPTPAFKDAGAAQTATNTDRITPALPAGFAAGDYAIAAVALFANVSPVGWSASGWTEVISAQSSGIRTALLKRQLQAGDGNPTFIYAGGGSHDSLAARIFTYSNVTQTTGGWYYKKSSGDQFNSTPPDQSTTLANSIMFSCAFVDFYQPLTLGTAQGFTERGSVNVASQGGFTAADKFIASAGSVVFPTYSGPQFSGLYFEHIGVALAP